MSVATLSGCVGEQSPEVGLGKIGVMNRRQNSVSIHVTVEKRGEGVYDVTHDLAGRTGNIVDGTTIIEEWMGDRTRYSVSVALTDGDLETTYSTADAESFVDDWGTNQCFSLFFTIETNQISTALGAMESCPTPS
ncbi:hypothetical protein [Halorarius halobius]|uniref:hypothetical protein n=1 Tax=Halorarius halobius TaxID=2962671 RepID=UPI0020CC991D|nr:hypothetical protein [Halorarius halobius]